MIVVADTTPINYLILIEHIDVLAKLYGHVIIPPIVRDELLRERTPGMVRQWMAQSPAWLEVRSPAPVSDPALLRLDAGERDAIALAEELTADQLIVDEILGRREAERRGLSVVGTIGVLKEGARLGLLDIYTAIEKLKLTSFHISPALLDDVLKDFNKPRT